MPYTFSFRKRFAKDFVNLPEDQKDAVLLFLDTYEKHGLDDLSRYKGKITHSWAGRKNTRKKRDFAKRHWLWHVHIGLPRYSPSNRGPYHTSDKVLHFQWPNKSDHIEIVKISPHYDKNKVFIVPHIGELK